MVTTSEVAVSVTIDDDKYLEEIVRELKKFGTVEIDPKQTIVCVVGDFIASKAGMAAQVFDAMNQVPIRAISYGGSFHNISMLVAEEHKVAALKALNKAVLHNE
jgi:aspartate kinase